MASHRRYNPLLGEWVLVSPHRLQRPWQGATEKSPENSLPSYDEHCYLCPGNLRANNSRNPNYTGTFVFDNDYPALSSQPSTQRSDDSHHLLKSVPEFGRCRVMCYSPHHNKTIAQLNFNEIEEVISTWQREYEHLGNEPEINHVQIFENKGEIMGCSNPHPHGQIWAQHQIPHLAATRIEKQQDYYLTHKKTLLSEYLLQEKQLGVRVVTSNASFSVVVPFWAVWPYETLIISHRAIPDILQLTPAETKDLAHIIKEINIKYDRLFKTSFPYSFALHQRPTDGKNYPGVHLHLQYNPPLLRSASVKKFMVGYEMFGEPQRDITAETAAKTLRDL